MIRAQPVRQRAQHIVVRAARADRFDHPLGDEEMGVSASLIDILVL